MKWQIFERLLALTPPHMVPCCWNLHPSYSSRRRVRGCIRNFWKFKFWRKQDVPKVCTFFSFCPTLRLCFSMKETKIEKSKNFTEKIGPWGYPKIAKSRPYLVPNCQSRWSFFGEKMGVVTLYRPRIKMSPSLCWSHDS